VGVINGIAEQTNLLALNATIEAAGGQRRQGIYCGCGGGEIACHRDRQVDRPGRRPTRVAKRSNTRRMRS
jgi:hypothetical protein